MTSETGSDNISICPTDGISDIITFENSLGAPIGPNYVYLLTDENEILEEVISSESYDFESSSMENQRIYGLHYDGTLLPAIGMHRDQSSATECFMHSSADVFVTVTKLSLIHI